MAFIQYNIDGFKVAWASRVTGWKINVDSQPTLTVWQRNIAGKKAWVHMLRPEDSVPVGDTVKLVAMTSDVKPAAVMLAKALPGPVEKCIGKEGKIFYEQAFELVTRLRK